MPRKAKLIAMLFLLTISPFDLLAEDIETILSADQITIKSDDILHAKGNVQIRRGDIFIVAAEMIVDKKKNKIEFEEIFEFVDGSGISLKAKEAVLSEDFSEGVVSIAQVLIDDTLRFETHQIDIKNNTIERASNIDRVTSCEDCKNGDPLWYFTASSATNDPINQNIVYRNVKIHIASLPLGYLPYLRLPFGVDRARGFLIPSLSITSNLGTGLKLPYFVPLGRSRDLLITPYISRKTKTIGYRYRQKFSKGELKLVGAISDDDLNLDKLRSYYRATGNLKLAYGINLEVKAGSVTDDGYLRDYALGSKDDLNTNLSISKELAEKNKFYNFKLAYVKDETEQASIEEYYALESNYLVNIDQNLLPGVLKAEITGNSALTISDQNQINRPPSSAKFGLQYSDSSYFGPIQISDGSFAQFTSFVNSKNTNSFEEDLIFQYGGYARFSFPNTKIKNNIHQFISPSLMVSYNQQRGRTDGDFFSGVEELSFGSLFSGKKYSSLSESELGVSISAGVDYKASWANKQSLQLSFGGFWFEDSTYNQSSRKGLEQQKLNILTSFDYQNNKRVSLSGQALLSEEGEVLNGHLKSKLIAGHHKIFGTYEFLSAKSEDRLPNDLETFDLSSSLKISEQLTLVASGRFDFTEQSMAKTSYELGMEKDFWEIKLNQSFLKQEKETSSIIATYNDDCTKIIASIKNTSSTLDPANSIKSFVFQIQLKPFASFSLPNF